MPAKEAKRVSPLKMRIKGGSTNIYLKKKYAVSGTLSNKWRKANAT